MIALGQTAITDTRNFDNSEYIAWQSSDALAGVMEYLNSDRQLSVMAHSMGNVVMGEALRKYQSAKIKTYIAAQAAFSAQYYDASVAARNDGVATGLISPTTPDVMGHFSINGNTNAAPYMAGVLAKVGKAFNYHNFDDYALRSWEINNNLKPDGMPPYHFQYSGSSASYTEGSDEFYRQAVIYVSAHQTQHLMNETERYRIFAYCAESRSRALGRVMGGVAGFTGWDLESAMGYDRQHYAHSREFRSNIAAEWDFWKKVKFDCTEGNQP